MNNAPPPPPSDPIYKRLYAFARMVEDLLRSLFGADLDADYRTLEKLPAEYVGEAALQQGAATPRGGCAHAAPATAGCTCW